MNKTAIKNFAVWARNKLIADITYKAGLIGVSEKGIAQPLPQSSKDLQFFDIGTKDYAQVAGSDIEQRNALIRAIQEKERTSDYKTAFKAVIEEVAYTWFNRLIAIRFMEVNEYLPSRIRVLSSENPAKNEPDFVTTPFDTDMEFTMIEQDKIMQLKDENKLDELFRMLFIKQCNKLHEILPELFEETNNYTELLLSISFTDKDGIVYHLVHDIEEQNFDITTQDEDGNTPGQVEIIGWMYQYYNTEPKDKLINARRKYNKDDIPFVTQLFTSDWIVRYMVENSLGRLWTEGHPDNNLRENWEYYLETRKQNTDIQEKIESIREEYSNMRPENIKVIDPCMGSGHILVYCFDILMQIYESQGYTQRDAAQTILENNLFGLDIDNRAAQLAYFSVMMKARQYDRRIFSRGIRPHIYAFEESKHINRVQLNYFGGGLNPIERNKAKLQMTRLLDDLVDAKEYGSLLNVESYDWDLLRCFSDSMDVDGQMTWDVIGIDRTQEKVCLLVEIGYMLSEKYDIVVTNPPYMNSSYMPEKLKKYVLENYGDFKSDLFAAFMCKILTLCKDNGHIGALMPYVWMFIASYEKMRQYVNDYADITSLVQLEYNAFEAACVPVASFTMRKCHFHSYGEYIKLSDFRGSENQAPRTLEAIHNPECGWRFSSTQDNFSKIPGSPVAYWVSNNFINMFDMHSVADFADVQEGLKTGDNERFIRFWYEVDFNKTNMCGCANPKWFYHTKGGGFRRWYGNQLDVLNYYNDGQELKAFKGSSLTGRTNYFRPCISYSRITSDKTGFRYTEEGSIPNMAGLSLYPKKEMYLYLGWLNTKIVSEILDITNPTINYPPGTIAKLPINLNVSSKEQIVVLAKENVSISRNDWDAYETSWDYLAHPLVLAAEVPDLNGGHKASLSDSYAKWEMLCEKRFSQLKTNEEELNRIFIDIYGLQDELIPDVEDKDVTVRKADMGRDIRSLLSYAVGCMFGRYSLDEPGLAYAGGEWDSSKYSTFIPDKDNCIPITDEAYFEDDLVGQFVSWMQKAFGEENLEANLDFIAKALGNKGTTSREVIRNYFLNDFMKDHIKIYQKRPIYWLFDSGKQNGFKALVYMHRWNADTVGNLRVEYLHKMQHTYEREIIRMQETIDNSRDSREVSKSTKRKDKLQKQLKETKDYDAKLAHIALSRIEIDLDDGVKVNYEKVQTGRDGKKMQILAKI